MPVAFLSVYARSLRILHFDILHIHLRSLIDYNTFLALVTVMFW